MGLVGCARGDLVGVLFSRAQVVSRGCARGDLVGGAVHVGTWGTFLIWSARGRTFLIKVIATGRKPATIAP